MDRDFLVTMTLECGYFAGARGALYGSRHVPEQAVRGRVVIVPPFGEERKCAYRMLHMMGDRLAALGFEVLRFDLSGTGESAGDLADIDLATWEQDASCALEALSSEAPVQVIGARLGANLALRLPAERLKSLVLLEPLVTGSDYLAEMMRRKQVKEMMSGGKATSAAETCETAWQAGEAVDFDGFQVSPKLASDLRSLSLTDDLGPQEKTAMLVLHVSGARKLSGPWANLGEQCASNPLWHVELVHEKPFWGRLEYHESAPLLDAVATFIPNPNEWKGLLPA